MPKGIFIDEKEREVQTLKSGIGHLEKRIERIERELESLHHAFDKVGSHLKELHEAAAGLMKKVHEFE